jgi:hypothetical protein
MTGRGLQLEIPYGLVWVSQFRVVNRFSRHPSVMPLRKLLIPIIIVAMRRNVPQQTSAYG